MLSGPASQADLGQFLAEPHDQLDGRGGDGGWVRSSVAVTLIREQCRPRGGTWPAHTATNVRPRYRWATSAGLRPSTTTAVITRRAFDTCAHLRSLIAADSQGCPERSVRDVLMEHTAPATTSEGSDREVRAFCACCHEPSPRRDPKSRQGGSHPKDAAAGCGVSRQTMRAGWHAMRSAGSSGWPIPILPRRALARGRQLRPGDPGERRPPEPRRHCASYVGRTGELERAGP